MPYYYYKKESETILYTNDKEALQLLYRVEYYLLARRIEIIDYLLLPHSLELILYTTSKLNGPMPLCNASLLGMFAHLGRAPHSLYSGSYELFHKSHCFARLGKSGTTLPFQLAEIIRVKGESSAVSIQSN